MTSPPASAAFATSTPGYKKLASLALEPEDDITLRARRVTRLRHLSNDEKAEHGLYKTLQQWLLLLTVSRRSSLLDLSADVP